MADNFHHLEDCFRSHQHYVTQAELWRKTEHNWLFDLIARAYSDRANTIVAQDTKGGY